MVTKKNAVLFPLVVISCFLINATLTLYLPSLPTIVEYFETTEVLVKNTIAYFILGTALASLVYGPLSDIMGRRPILLINHIIYIIGSLISLCSWSIDVLILGRFIEGLGIGGCLSVGMAACGDIASGVRLAKKYSILSMCIGLSPAISPVLGGYIQFYFGWRYIFAVLAICSFLVFLIMALLFPESNSGVDLSWKNINTVTQHAARIWKYPKFLFFPFVAGLAYIGMNITFQAFPFFVVHVLNYSSKLFGWLSFILGIGFVIGSQLSNLLQDKFDRIKLFLSQFLLITLLAALSLFWNWESISLYSLFVTGFIYFLLCGLILPTAMGLAMEQITRNKGSGASVYMFIFMMMAFFGGNFFSYCSTQNAHAYSIFALGGASLGAALVGGYYWMFGRSSVPS